MRYDREYSKDILEPNFLTYVLERPTPKFHRHETFFATIACKIVYNKKKI